MGIITTWLLIAVLMVLTLMVWFFIEEKKKNRTKMSFRETLDLTGLPIVTFYQGNSKYNFVLDTGCSNSIIDSRSPIRRIPVNKGTDVYSIDGKTFNASVVEIELFYKGNRFESEFLVGDLKNAFENIKKDNGIVLTGFLGSDFFDKYKYILDFKDYIAYTK